jgi:hypothetical protein
MSRRPLDERFRQQAEQCRGAGSPLTAALLEGAADDLGRPGPVRDLLAPLEGDPAGSVPSLRLAAALHRLVLERRAPRLALHYPSVGGTAPVEGVWEVAREVLLGEPDVPQLLRHPVQTNEVGRAAVLYGGLLHVTAGGRLPVRLLEVGASAGLLLQVDRYAYEVGDRVLGDPASPLRLVQPWQGAAPRDADLQVGARAGCDPSPLDPTSTADRLTLTSCVWPDQVDRLERLRAALQVASRDPVRVEPLPASAFLERELAEPVPGAATVVWHSLVWQYLPPQERAAVTDVLGRAAQRARPGAPLHRLSLEPTRDGRFLVELTSWPGGDTRLLAVAQGHGPPVVWS